MIEVTKIIKASPLFEGLTEGEIENVLNCLGAFERWYIKDQFVFRRGDEVSSLGLVLQGGVHIVEEDYWGNRTILSSISPGDLFAESYACLHGQALRVSVLSVGKTRALFLDVGKVLETCSSSCGFHTRLIKNLMMVLARKNLLITEKSGFLSKRSTKEKLLAYLSAEAQRQGSTQFDIAFNRQELADYLAVDRSALSRELAKLQEEGVLEFRKNHFALA